MPTYEYKCKKCGHHFEIVQRITDAPIKKCRRCGGRVTRLLSPTAFILKGSGWYLTDYARKGKDTKPQKEAKPPEIKADKKEKTIEKTLA